MRSCSVLSLSDLAFVSDGEVDTDLVIYAFV